MQNRLQDWLALQVGLYVMFEFSFCIRRHQSRLDKFIEDLYLIPDPERSKP